MSSATTELDRMIRKIQQDTQEQVERIKTETQQHISQRWSVFERQKEKALADARTKADAESGKIWARHDAAIKREQNRIYLKSRDMLLHQAKEALFRMMEQEISKPGYEDVLCRWIMEGIIALDSDVCIVNASIDEKKIMTPEFLTRVTEESAERTGRRVELVASPEEPLPVQGVVVSTRDGKIAYNNQVPVRYQRKEARIRELLLSELVDPLLAAKDKTDE